MGEGWVWEGTIKGAHRVIIALRYNYCPIDQTWHISLPQIISRLLYYVVSARYVVCLGVLF